MHARTRACRLFAEGGRNGVYCPGPQRYPSTGALPAMTSGVRALLAACRSHRGHCTILRPRATICLSVLTPLRGWSPFRSPSQVSQHCPWAGQWGTWVIGRTTPLTTPLGWSEVAPRGMLVAYAQPRQESHRASCWPATVPGRGACSTGQATLLLPHCPGGPAHTVPGRPTTTRGTQGTRWSVQRTLVLCGRV